MSKFLASCIQLNSCDNLQNNIAMIEPQIRAAAEGSAAIVALPENAFLMSVGEKFHQQVFTENEHPALRACRQWSQQYNLWIIIGSLAVKRSETVPKGTAPYVNRSYLIAPDGRIVAYYDKIHLFDVSIPGGESHKESKNFTYGKEAVLTHTPLARIGMTICYDVRFPYLYRNLAHAGAELLTVPAAFTRFTGEKGGWHVLNRARAMETGSYVLAPAQCGSHAGGRKTYGHSLIIGPWGDILAEGGDEPTVIFAEIDLAEVRKTRQVMPSLQHDRTITLKETHYDSVD